MTTLPVGAKQGGAGESGLLPQHERGWAENIARAKEAREQGRLLRRGTRKTFVEPYRLPPLQDFAAIEESYEWRGADR